VEPVSARWSLLVPAGLALGFAAAASLAGEATGGGGAHTSGLLDRRAYAQLTPDAAKFFKRRSNKPYALVLHQMGFSRGNDPSKYDKVTAHFKVLPNGTIVWSWDDDARLPAAGGLNHGSWSVEFAGNFPSRAGSTDPDHYYRPLPFDYRDAKGQLKHHKGFGMNLPTQAQYSAGRWLIDYLIPRGLTHVFAHIQGGPDRENDPGPDLWWNVGEWAIRERGLEWGGPDFAVYGGKPIPGSWRTAGGARVT